jgi:hypothetical protein
VTTFLGPDDATNVTESRRKRGQDGVVCFLHLRDLVSLHREAAPASAVSFVQTLEAKVIAEKRAQEKDWPKSAPEKLADGMAIFDGPNTDHDVTPLDRYDGEHFVASGQEKYTDAWIRLFHAYPGLATSPLPREPLK